MPFGLRMRCTHHGDSVVEKKMGAVFGRVYVPTPERGAAGDPFAEEAPLVCVVSTSVYRVGGEIDHEGHVTCHRFTVEL